MKKNRFNTYLDEDLSKKMTAAMELCDAGSESEFIRNAVEYYIGYIFSEKSSDYLSPIITDTMLQITQAERRNTFGWMICTPK